jgi:hypothetical protein
LPFASCAAAPADHITRHPREHRVEARRFITTSYTSYNEGPAKTERLEQGDAHAVAA